MKIQRISLPMAVDILEDGKRKLKRNLVYEIDGKRIIVPIGFVTDYSSHPPFSRFIVRFDKVDYAGVVHDYLYKFAVFNGKFITRRFADDVWFNVAMSGTHHANYAQALASWVGLRIGGWITWRKYRKSDKNLFNE